ncbi:hypothetical protein QBC41DRAFT_387469 [Cercophora samala]|uniref:Mid2 domain-containing protein n=1 Tax=Cercophora samala TaxID=330535 RepID=A0AA39YJ50_9PEZI|nr:hypothetical protein QBC41DRAFT_387469 [Cercophora samala]
MKAFLFFLFCVQVFIGPGLAALSQLSLPANATTLVQHKRQGTVLITKYFTLFSTGDASRVRTANNGSDCRVDLIHDLWGFCPTSVISATDCGLAGSCVDKHACSRGCGFTNAALTTFTCSDPSAPFCSTALLTLPNNVGPFTYLACGKGPNTDNYLAFTTIADTAVSSITPETTTSSSSTVSSAQNDPSTSDPEFSPSDKTTQPNVEDNENPQSNNIGAIIGGVIGSIALLCASGIVIVWLLRRNRHSSKVSGSKPYLNSSPGSIGKESESTDHKPEVAAWTHYNRAGWGPQELSADHNLVQNMTPVELPTMYHSRP